MKKINFNKSWMFTLDANLDCHNTFGFKKYTSAIGAAARFYANSNWEIVDLPHDWAVALPKNPFASPLGGGRDNSHHHPYASEFKTDSEKVYNVGWYRKEFEFAPSWENKRLFLEFEGVFRNSSYWVNGVYIDNHKSGYTGFTFEITDHLVKDGTNSVAVHVDCEQPEGWFYEGAGIYRNVFLHVCEPVYFKYGKTFIRPDIDGKVIVSGVLVNDTENSISQKIDFSVTDKNGKKVASTSCTANAKAFSETEFCCNLKIENPALWSIDTPNLYTLSMKAGNEVTTETFGFRSIRFDADKGFFLNGKHTKIRGACVHQDFGGVGSALSDNLNYYKISRLKEMGVNAYRCSHNPPSPALLRACDELGMLVMDETRMFGTSPEAVRQLTSLIERDRNHPSVFIWCIGNEEFSVENDEWSYRLCEKASRIVRSLDDTRAITYGGDNGANFEGANGAAEVRGINYIRNGKPRWVDEYHKEHPNQPIIGTEESSYVLSRGGAKNDLGNGILDCTGDVTMMWGSTPKGWVKFVEERDWFTGAFMWTGFDYRGEPNPFFDSNYSSSFGTIDLCGMEKPPFYYYKSWWTDEPVLKIAPHWDYKKGETADLTVFTNCEKVTLFVNGKDMGTKTVEKYDVLRWSIPFEKGVLSAEGTKNGKTYRTELVTPEKASLVQCRNVLEAKSEDDVSIYELCALDKNGNFCPNANGEVELDITGGTIIGVGNGDPYCDDYEQKPKEEEVRYIRNFDTEHGIFTLPQKVRNVLVHRYEKLVREDKKEYYEDDYRIVGRFGWQIAEPKTYTYTAKIQDAEKFEYIEFERVSGNAHFYLNGVEIGNNCEMDRYDCNKVRPYRFYCNFKKGTNEIKVVVSTHEDFLYAMSGYVKLGREVTDTPWKVRLHYGLARVFVKSDKNAKIKAKLKK